MSTPPGLRARKHQRTRVAIERAALELSIEQGFARTTVAQIAARADVAPRTVYGRYASKEAIVFGSDEHAGDLAVALSSGEGDLLQRLERFLRARDSDHPLARLRVQALAADPGLRLLLRARLDDVGVLVGAQLAHETGRCPQDAGVRVFAAGVVELLVVTVDAALARPADPLAAAAPALAVLRAALDALTPA